MKKILLSLMVLLSTGSFIIAQNDDAAREKALKEKMKMEAKEGWQNIGALGFDLGQLMIINPYVGQGQDRLGIGGAIGYSANYKKGLMSWNNQFNVNLSVQRFGSGVISPGSTEKQPFEKSIDILSFTSNVGYKVNETSKWAYSADLSFLSQLTSSYQGNNGKYYMTNVPAFNTLLKSKFLSPAEITAGLGMNYDYSDALKFYLSPLTAKIFYVADDNIAKQTTDDGANIWGFANGKNVRFDLGANLKAMYTTKIMDRIAWTSGLSLFSNYLKDPQRIDVIWLNTLGLEIIKNLNLQVKGDLYYDYDKINQLSDKTAVGGVKGFGRTFNFIEQVLLTYSLTF